MTAQALLARGVLAALGFVLVIAFWQGMVWHYGLPKIVLPTPGQVTTTLAALLINAAFWRDVAVSLQEFMLGYLAGGLAGIITGFLIGERPMIRLTIGPIVEALRFIVPFAWIPLTVLWFGTSLVGKVILVAYAVFFVMVVTTARALATVDPTLMRVGSMLGMGPLALSLKVRLRAAAPAVASGAKAAAAVGWIAVVAAEYIGASAGLGVMITNASMSLGTDTVIAGMIVIGAIGAGVSWLVDILAARWLNYGR